MVQRLAVALAVLMALAIGGWAGQAKKPSKAKKKGKRPMVVMETTKGTIEMVLYPEDAPKTCANFEKLVRGNFYNGIVFHRVVADFVVQAGDPQTKQNPNHPDAGKQGAKDDKGRAYTVQAEIKRNHKRGTVAMARTGDEVNPERRSSSSQFYICLNDVPQLDGAYTAFGQVTKGMDVVDRIERGDKIRKAYMK